MWIFLSFVGFIALIVLAIMFLPVHVIIKTDEKGELFLRYKILFKVFGEDPNPNDPIIKTLKEAVGINRLKNQNLQKSIKNQGMASTLNETLRLLFDLIKELCGLLKYCTAKSFKFNIVCHGKDAADAAMEYGQCCAIVYPFLGALSSIIKIKKRGQKINIFCDYTNEMEDKFQYDIVLSIFMYHILAAFFRVAYKEAKRTALDDAPQNYSNNKNVKKD
jgi:hypothetical protein